MSVMETIDLEKRELRALVRSRMPRGDVFVAASVAAQARLAASEFAASAKTIGVYRPLASECGTAALVAALEARGVACCYPVVIPGERALSFRRSVGVFVSGSLGVEEPTGSAVSLGEIELLVVPAIAVDERGNRIGRGKGYYDATLERFAGASVALIFEAQLVPHVPLGIHDRPVRAVCTESRLILATSA
jgi:5-formyltetrahydrofolate cyclo-ligase